VTARGLATTLALILFFAWAGGRAYDAQAHYQPGRHNVRHAINQAWCGRANSYCYAGVQAWAVAGCETGYTYSVWATNGQYLGLFQMGVFARARYGHARDPWGQARAAHRYWLAAGWRPWTCQP